MIPLALQHGLIHRLDALATRFGRGARPPAHLVTGLQGERAALFHLRALGYTVIARRWSSTRIRGDLDLVAWHGDVLCFVEVKTRTAHDRLEAEAAVDRTKRTQLRRLARAFLKGFAEPARSRIAARFDVVAVYLLAAGTECVVLPSAFGWAEPAGDRW